MKYLCEACERLVEPRSFAVERGSLELVCPRCEGTTVCAATQRAAVIPLRHDPPALEVVAPPEVVPASERCPKCAEPKRGRTSCAKCGLVFELYTPELDAGLENLRNEFTNILEQWGTPEAQQLVDRAGLGRLGTLARICRHHLADYPDDARARSLLSLLSERSVALTMAASVPHGTASSDSTRRQAYLLGGAVAVAILGCALAYLLLRFF